MNAGPSAPRALTSAPGASAERAAALVVTLSVVNSFSRPLRKELDRFALPYVHVVIDEVKTIRQSLVHEARAIKVSLVDEARGLREAITTTVADEARGLRETLAVSTADEARGLREALTTSGADEARGLREMITATLVDEGRGVKETITASLVDESRGVREAVTNSIADEARGVREAVTASIGDECRALRSDLEQLASEVGVMRRDLVEMTRMLRMQGDASDQVAEVMGRTLTRLSAEVEALAGALDRSGVAFETSSS